MKVWVLGSGSEGNATLIECGDTRVLVDAGFSPRELARRLRTIDVEPASIEACVITHEHLDHARGAVRSAKKWGWKLFASHGTADVLAEVAQVHCERVTPGTTIALASATFTTRIVPHDANIPLGVRVTSNSTGATAVVCTDLGSVTSSVRTLCERADILVLESNHDEGMLRAGPYPPSVVQRIGSRVGHLSNRAAASFTRDLVHRDLAHVILAHMSERCNDHGVAQRAMVNALRTTRFRGATHLTMQHGVIGPFSPSAARVEPPRQLLLAL